MLGFLSSKNYDPSTSHRDSVGSKTDLKMPPAACEETITPEKKLEIKIFSLYRLVWNGIYRVNDRHGPTHLNRLAELFVGAGMSSFVNKPEQIPDEHTVNGGRRWNPADIRVLQPLRAALTNPGPRGLRLFDGMSVASLEAVVEVLEAYAKEIASVNALYQLLRGLQVGFRMPTEDDEKAVLEQFIPTAHEFARRILHLDARLCVLVSDLEDEFWNAYGPVTGRDGWLVHDVVFPPIQDQGRSKKVISFKAMK
ncbi:uncharacterized protein N7498_002058 [Penicillium cinerascens]|uniref:Uncharacterized protein n=1 Tax=Penicillium cinerascens TaxID=70096 RepID=A0A9W9N9D4_9EURO|nr:uncharacterized protein N7498_002058 [Penicillium cinerascens]KAJ5215651.1 hypothetical protein N7498_002058 [Penicillium cinerascens]